MANTAVSYLTFVSKFFYDHYQTPVIFFLRIII